MIACIAGIREILQNCLAAMLAGNNVVGLVLDQDNIIWKTAILATVSSASDYLRT
jgi:hypothetical protein